MAAILVGLANCFYGIPVPLFLIVGGLISGYLIGQSFTPASQRWLALMIGVGAAVHGAARLSPVEHWGHCDRGGIGVYDPGRPGSGAECLLGAVILMGVLGAALVGFLFYCAGTFS